MQHTRPCYTVGHAPAHKNALQKIMYCHVYQLPEAATGGVP